MYFVHENPKLYYALNDTEYIISVHRQAENTDNLFLCSQTATAWDKLIKLQKC